MNGWAMTSSSVGRCEGSRINTFLTKSFASSEQCAIAVSSSSPFTMLASSLKGVTPASIVKATQPRLQMSTFSLNSRFGNSTNSMVKSAERPPKISAIAVTPDEVPAPISLKSLMNGISVMLVPFMDLMAQPSPMPSFSAWPPPSMPLTMAPLPSGRCEMMPKPGDISVGGLKVYGPCSFSSTPFGTIISFALTSSGAMISVVPTQLFAISEPTYLATPKSISLTCVSAVSSSPQTRIFSAFKSRWSTDFPWTNFRPSTVCLKTLAATFSSKYLPSSLM
mmetsp:Transcript_60095/g.115890  ORF Transcript_60095/g.115890 Transcript_60095/m.115890 type:complete len:279 (-) Transcript_60095:731-1567(-)